MFAFWLCFIYASENRDALRTIPRKLLFSRL